MYDYNLLPKPVFGFDPKVDLQAVDQSGVIDLHKAVVNGVIDGDITVTDEMFNGVQDPSVLMPRPKDNFERMRQGEYVKSSLKAAKTKSEQVTPMGETK